MKSVIEVAVSWLSMWGYCFMAFLDWWGGKTFWVGFAHGACLVVGFRYEGKELIPIVVLGLHGVYFEWLCLMTFDWAMLMVLICSNCNVKYHYGELWWPWCLLEVVVRQSKLDGADCQCGAAVPWRFWTGGAARHLGWLCPWYLFVVGRRYEGKELIPIVGLGLHG